ncbi:hypothetical protein Mapa_011922 [Marchantia paleacea]|nr:hypothetical protein Mapa_011922 [Marchantia paleacea]
MVGVGGRNYHQSCIIASRHVRFPAASARELAPDLNRCQSQLACEQERALQSVNRKRCLKVVTVASCTQTPLYDQTGGSLSCNLLHSFTVESAICHALFDL